MTRDQTALALRGIRVLDFTWIHAGPSATRILSDQGAEVIKVESNNALSVIGGPASATARGLGQRHNWNAGKLSISLNMKTPQAIDIARRLVAVSDVVAENFSGRVMPSWGLDYDSIRPINPSIIMLSMSGFGRTGPWKDRVSYGQTLQAWSGFTQLTGFPDTDPSGPASAYSDAVGGMAGVQAVLLALIHRARTGRGQWLDVSQFESLSSLLETLVLDMSVNGPAAATGRAGNRLPYGGGAPHGAYRCRGVDRWVAISIFSDEEWRAFVDRHGQPPMGRRPTVLYGQCPLPQRRRTGLLRGILDHPTHCGRGVMGLLQAAGVAAGVVQTGADLSHDPQLKERGFFRPVLDYQGEYRIIESAPYQLSRTPGSVTKGAPAFGADMTYVLRELLGMSDDELADCAIDGVFD